VLFGVTAATTEIALVVKSNKDSDFKQWMDGYIPGWAFHVDEIHHYSKSTMEWLSERRKDLFHGDKESEKAISSTKHFSTTQDLSKDKPYLESPTKEGATVSAPLEGNDGTKDRGKKDLEPVSKVTDNAKKSSENSNDDNKQTADLTVSEKIVQEPVVEQKRKVEPKKTQHEEEPVVDAKESDVAEDPKKQQEQAKNDIESSLIKCLEEFSKACNTVVDSNLMLIKAMEKARSDIAITLLQPSPDYKKLSELDKAMEETTVALKGKIEESYAIHCNTFQELTGIVKEATDAGLDSLVSQAQASIFEHAVFIQTAEDGIRINQAVHDVFNNFINTVKSTESELAKELTKLDAPVDVKAGLEETAVLLLAERRVKLLYDKIKQLSPDEVAKSLEKQKVELTKIYEEKMRQAMDESRADMQERIEASVSGSIYYRSAICSLYVIVA